MKQHNHRGPLLGAPGNIDIADSWLTSRQQAVGLQLIGGADPSAFCHAVTAILLQGLFSSATRGIGGGGLPSSHPNRHASQSRHTCQD